MKVAKKTSHAVVFGVDTKAEKSKSFADGTQHKSNVHFASYSIDDPYAATATATYGRNESVEINSNNIKSKDMCIALLDEMINFPYSPRAQIKCKKSHASTCK